MGTISPDQLSNSNVMLTAKNYGAFSIFGVDLGMVAYLSEKLRISGSYSRVSDECYDANGNGSCLNAEDIALNAPTNKGSLGVDVDDKVSGLFYGGRVRMSGGFPVNSGVYSGVVESFNVVDVNAGYTLPGTGATISATVNNVLNNKHREFIGVPELGTLALLQVEFEF